MPNYESAAGVGLSILIITQIPSLFSNLLPYPCDIEKAHPQDRYSKSVRNSEVQVAGMAVALGFAGTLITGTPWPFLGTLVMVAWLCYHYECAIRYEGDEI